MKRITVLFVAMTMSLCIYAQPQNKEQHKQKIKAAKIGMISNKLELTSAEAEKFWPVYWEYDKEKKVNQKAMRALHKKEMTSDSDYMSAINAISKLRENEIVIDRSYNDKFLKVISAKQLFNLFKAEHAFKKMLLHKLEGKKMGQRGPGPNGGKPTKAVD